ncbi:GGDEF domain-containing protein [Devosia sp. 63-57]|uniref:GGDEF domain-containing protein n=1 Tax=Devosia sp. 63-57 TaxID=1895751 RepID=UPI00086F8EAD|nr:GGDEF domain-containing protein [Devosia sp. 63-57]ODT48791.1 MAG: hypothetical protein ABS74_09750 [Pelagibacterium sp. SCN 63-126]ODU86920.1 MAG: hypothetical protein ABT14_07375 [Pelagibacterium sp. SCN 63-17]OJX44281.1 MAG: hypothetical protein BGO80_01460 [Devosia sp. 63-57]
MQAPYKSGLQTWAHVARWTLLGTLICAIVSIAVNLTLFQGLDNEARLRALVSAVFLPAIFAFPLFLYLGFRVRGLEMVNRRLSFIARTDSLTSCLNRGAFTARIEALLAEAPENFSGALLMIDADNFKAINDAYGHAMGDEALTIIARSIRAALRTGDLVGRMGGEEFAVFLPKVDERQAARIAERIRHCVNTADFNPEGRAHPLSVSVGGAAFEDRTSFSALFRIADRQLYGAKKAGRNFAAIVHVGDAPDIALRQPA